MTFWAVKDAPAQQHLLIPIMPTPNGRFHLGHIAGPYLKMDLIARHLRRQGDQARIITGTDSYESHVLCLAEEQNRDPAEVCAHYHQAIRCDLEALDIGLAEFVPPLSSEWSGRYQKVHRDWVDRMEEQGAVVAVRERLPYSPAAKRYVVGCWLSGRCPDCSSQVTGYFCEDCGMHIRPEDLADPHDRVAGTFLHWRSVSSLYLRLPDPGAILAHLEQMAFPTAFRSIAERFLARNGGLVRLSVPGGWGVPLPPDGPAVRSLFSYTGLMPYSLLCGEVHADLARTGTSAFAATSDVVTVSSFGIDNSVPMLVGAIGGALLDPASKPFDRFLINHFLNLEGQKFSTSREHAIWVSDIVAQPRISTDAVRFYLAKASPDDQPRNLDVQHFISTVNDDLVNGISRSAGAAIEWLEGLAGEPGTPASNLVQRLESAIREQARALGYITFSSADTVAVISAWSEALAGIQSATEAYWCLKGLALLAWPIMPRFGAALWGFLGGEGEPAVSRFLIPTVPERTRIAPTFELISRADLDPCLPVALRTMSL